MRIGLSGSFWAIVLWILQVALRVMPAGAAHPKLFLPKDRLAAAMPWTATLPDVVPRAIGAAEGLAVIGLLLPAALPALAWAATAAALGTVFLIASESIFNVQRKARGARRNSLLGRLLAFPIH